MSNVDFNSIHYAPWLEKALQGLVSFPNIKGVGMCAVTDSGEVYVNYYQLSVADKIAVAGYIQQDAMLDTLKVNKLIKTENEDEE